MDQSDERHLRRAIELAVAARAAGDMPLGSLIVGPQGEVLGRDRSLRTRPGRVAPSARRLQDLEQAGAVAPDPNSATTRDRSPATSLRLRSG